ncbi:MAG TPA: acylphosphatase [Ruminococcus sp.]|nr:acylphosphatase [Ruminococcus sp.]
MKKIRKHFIFTGEVQGVGFRWNAKQIALKYGVSGWAENVYDGSVEMEAEGTPEDIDCLIEELNHARWAYIEHIDMKEIPVQGGYAFEIR